MFFSLSLSLAFPFFPPSLNCFIFYVPIPMQSVIGIRFLVCRLWNDAKRKRRNNYNKMHKNIHDNSSAEPVAHIHAHLIYVRIIFFSLILPLPLDFCSFTGYKNSEHVFYSVTLLCWVKHLEKRLLHDQNAHVFIWNGYGGKRPGRIATKKEWKRMSETILICMKLHVFGCRFRSVCD